MTAAKGTLQVAALGLLCAFLGLLCVILAPFAWNAQATYRKTATILLHVDKATGEIARAAQESVSASRDTDTAVKHLDAVVQSAGDLITAAQGTADAATGTLQALQGTTQAASGTAQALGRTADAATARIDAMASTQARVDAAVDQLATVPETLRAALAPLPALQISLTRTTAAAGDLIGGPGLKLAIDNLGTLEGNLGTATDHFDRKWLAPYSGKHPRRHAIWHFTQRAIGLGARGAQGVFYGVGIANGQ